jgi:hypothetical protein
MRDIPITVTLNEQEAWNPPTQTAVMETVVMPTENTLPRATEGVTTGAAEVGAKTRVAGSQNTAGWDLPVTTMLAGQMMAAMSVR